MLKALIHTIGRFIDKVECDILPFKAYHILLRRPWFFDKKAQHCGYANTYTSKCKNKHVKMVPCKDSHLLKLKKMAGSFLFQCMAYGGEGILGPPPKLNGV